MKKLLLLLLLATPYLHSEEATLADEPTATVVKVTGPAYYRAEEGDLSPLEPGQLLIEGDQLVTKEGGTAHVALPDGSTLSLGPNTEMNIKNLSKEGPQAKNLFEVLAGRVNAIVHKLRTGDSFEIESANAVAAVKGTQFELNAEGAESAVTVQEGTVALSDHSRQKTVMVPPLHRATSNVAGPKEAHHLSSVETAEFSKRWEHAREVHGQRAQLLKSFEASSVHHRAALQLRQKAIRQHVKEKTMAKAISAKPKAVQKEAEEENKKVEPKKNQKIHKHPRPKKS